MPIISYLCHLAFIITFIFIIPFVFLVYLACSHFRGLELHFHSLLVEALSIKEILNFAVVLIKADEYLVLMDLAPMELITLKVLDYRHFDHNTDY